MADDKSMEKRKVGALEAQIDKLQKIKLGFIILVYCNMIQGVGYIDLTNYNMTTTGEIPILPLQLLTHYSILLILLLHTTTSA
jgi:hypothetical protein